MMVYIKNDNTKYKVRKKIVVVRLKKINVNKCAVRATRNTLSIPWRYLKVL